MQGPYPAEGDICYGVRDPEMKRILDNQSMNEVDKIASIKRRSGIIEQNARNLEERMKVNIGVKEQNFSQS